MQHLQPNSTLQGGKYRIEQVLGQGGFGITYLAEHCVLNSKVAIKEFFMKKFCNRDEKTSAVTVGSEGSVETVERCREKFMKEARLLFNMDNQHIVRVYDAFVENGTAYYVMEHLDCGCLNDMLAHVAFSEETALKFARQIADALKYIHEKNVLHLDVKPANILLRANGDAVLIDFGISKHYDDEGGQTSAAPLGVSRGYAPLEQYNQDVRVFTPCSDIYSLGATMYKMVTGNTPPDASIVNEDGLPAKPNTITESTWNAIVKAMSPIRKDRPQSVDDFLRLIAVEDIVSSIELKDESTLFSGNDAPEDESSLQFVVDGVRFRMIKVEGGTFDMKETVKCGFLGLSSKEIVQRTTLSDYCIGETQVTQALWTAVMGNNPSRFKGDNLPVERVSWFDCQIFIKALNEKTGKTFRLPTEAEWEFAARGGKKSRGYEYSGSDNIGDVAWYRDNSEYKTRDVATKQPNELGIYDMSGNVWEWCNDWYDEYRNNPQTNPTGPDSGYSRVFRGGDWNSYAGDCCSLFRCFNTLGYNGDTLGLRLVLVP